MKKVGKNIKRKTNKINSKMKEVPNKIKQTTHRVKINTKNKIKRRKGKHIINLILIIGIVILAAFLTFAIFIIVSSPDFSEQELYQTEPTILYDKNGDEIATIGDEDLTILTYDEIPEVLVDALVATEDSRFFEHNGVDIFRFAKASLGQLMGSSDAGGASTLSMQVVKNNFTKKGKTENKIQSLIRKFQDVYMAVFKLEANYTKEEIIEFYLNSQWFANDGNVYVSGGIFGIERASEYYFGKSAKDLNLAESSLIAGMFQNPQLYNLYKNPEGCRNRQKVVLNLMVRHNYITEEQKNEVLEIPISSLLVSHDNSKNTSSVSSSAQAFIDYVIDEVEEKLNLDPTKTSLKIYTTFDPSIQSTLEKVEKGEVYQFPNDVVEEGIAVTSTTDGSIVALSGGRSYQAKSLNRATDISRQPGSTAKPLFDYAMYIENFTQSTYDMILDAPTTYSNGTSINNYDNSYKGLISMRYALKDSRNIPALKVFKKVYSKDKSLIENFVHSIGIDYGDTLYESYSIGAFNGLSPLESSAAYAVFARGGYYIEPYSYTKVINNNTGEEFNYSYTKEKVLEESTAFMINDILVDAYGGKGVTGTQIAGKTGTTNLDKETKSSKGLPSGAVMDAWIVSYSPSYSISLWYGYDKIYDDAAKNKYYLTSTIGSTGRRQIMNALATSIHKKNETFTVPSNVTKVNIIQGVLPATLCTQYTSANCAYEYFVKGTEPTESSFKYSALENPTGLTTSMSGSTITLKWNPVNIPDGEEVNDEVYGELGYEIYFIDANGQEKYLEFTTNTNYTYTITDTSANSYTFKIKTAYSSYKDSRSSGITATQNALVDDNVNNMLTNGNNDTLVQGQEN